MNWWRRQFDLFGSAVMATVGAFILPQVPAFLQQYRQRLGGHLDEARLGAEYVARRAQELHVDPAAMTDLAKSYHERMVALQHAYDAISTGWIWTDVTGFFNTVQWGIFDKAWAAYVPAVDLSQTGLSFVFAGMMLGMAIFHALMLPVDALWGRWQRQKTRRRQNQNGNHEDHADHQPSL
jgi:hypothetical protein